MRELTLLFATDKVLQEVDGQGLKGREVRLSIHREEHVDFPFALVLGGEGCRRDT